MSYIIELDKVKKGLVSQIYLIYGEETYLARQLEKAITAALLSPEDRDMNLNIIDSDSSPQELINLIDTIPFFGDKNLIVVRNSTLFKNRKTGQSENESDDKTDERLINLLSNMPAYSYVVFLSPDKIDKRRKVYKTIEKFGTIVEVAPLKPKDVRVWLQGKLGELNKRMSHDAMEHFLASVSLMSRISLGFLESELDKAAIFSEKQIITKDDLISVMSTIPEASIFAMIDAVSEKNTQKALVLLSEQLASGEHPIKILSLLTRQVRLLWQAKELMLQGYGSREISDELGLVSFVGEKVMKQCKGFDDKKLKEVIIVLAEADADLKSGRATSVVLEKIIIDLCKKNS
ncbi:DNA polymerase III subunit delta [Dendrosporobacter sp. 1207_IL3150]|uniref:DNA polymerase III subunit delta n=1 Tax=Dendrosporobacter sp. 1207_IL3150 TaxID=3084054 RepID=UPI002FD88CD7